MPAVLRSMARYTQMMSLSLVIWSAYAVRPRFRVANLFPLQAESQTFCAATSYSDGLRYPGYQPDGFLGLGFPSLSTFKVTPPFHTLVAEHILPTNSFGLCPSELYIGGTNNKLFKGAFTYVPVVHQVRLCKDVPGFGIDDQAFQAYWQTQIDGLYLNDHRIAGTTNLDVIIDSGTSMIVGDKKTLQAFYSQIPGSYVIAPGAFEYYNSTEIRFSMAYRKIN